MSILSTAHLTKLYGSEPNIVKALDDVSISIEPEEFVAIIGTSGSGKSTLLNMLGGLDCQMKTMRWRRNTVRSSSFSFPSSNLSTRMLPDSIST